MKTYVGVEIQLHAFLTLALVGNWSPSCLDCFTLGERAPSTLWIRFWVGTRVCLDVVVKFMTK